MQDPLERLLPLLGDDYPADELARRLWSAQAQTLFPLIMQEWRRFTDTWRMEIEDGFDFASRFLPHGVQGSDGETVRSPDDMELANVIYLSRHRRYDDSGLQIVHIPDAAAMERVELLYDMRNQIAHGKVCKYEDVFKLINAAK
jgi:hypothetical protein